MSNKAKVTITIEDTDKGADMQVLFLPPVNTRDLKSLTEAQKVGLQVASFLKHCAEQNEGSMEMVHSDTADGSNPKREVVNLRKPVNPENN